MKKKEVCLKIQGEDFNYTFFQWELPTEVWNTLSWFDKLRAIILFKVIMPKSKLIVDGLHIGKYLFLHSWIHKLIIYVKILFL